MCAGAGIMKWVIGAILSIFSLNVHASAVPEVISRLKPGLCISNHPQEKTYVYTSDQDQDLNVAERFERLFRIKRIYRCNYYCMNDRSEIDIVTAEHTDYEKRGGGDGREFLCLGIRTVWVETPMTKRWGFYNVTGAAPFRPETSKSPELIEWYRGN
jgi:hypothetical protein